MASGIVPQGVPLRLMALGASITWGLCSTDGNGYRQKLLTQLQDAGYTVKYVGSQKSGNMANPENEGFSGLLIHQVAVKAKAAVPLYLPNIYTINAGTNDAGMDFKVADAGARMQEMLSYIWSVTPEATIILSTLVNSLNAAGDRRVERVNAQYTQLVHALRSEGKRIVLADMHSSEGPQRDDMADTTHPNDNGYAKMANVWFAAIQKASAEGLIQPAQ